MTKVKTATAWAHLPNAAHIDSIIAALPTLNEKQLEKAKARGAARGAARVAAWDAARDAARGAALDAVSALVAWDWCGVLLSEEVPLDVVDNLSTLGNDAATLLLGWKVLIEGE